MIKKTILMLTGILFLIRITTGWTESRKMKLDVDWAIFQYDQQQVMLEVYYSIFQNEIHYLEQSGQLIGLTMGQLKIFKGDEPFRQFAWKNQNVLQDTAQISELKVIVDRERFTLNPGDYRFRLVLTDLQDQTNRDSTEWTLNLKQPDISVPYLSDIELASSVSQNPEATDSPFYKNTLIVIPNPGSIFSSGNPALFFYVEAYHLPQEQLTNGYYLHYYITDGGNKPIAEIKPKKYLKAQVVHPSVEFGMINVGRLPSSAYLLQVEILTAGGNAIASQQKKFYVYQKDDIVRQPATSDSLIQMQFSIFKDMDSTQLAHEYDIANYLFNKEHKSIWLRLDNQEGKRQFLTQFWRMLDPDPATRENEFRNQYLDRITYANQHFGAFRKEGWLTDRGRVFVLYGEPSDIERHPNEPNMYPYELWSYDQFQSGVIFVFADLEGYKNYRLLHSNLKGEVRNDYYMDIIRTGH